MSLRVSTTAIQLPSPRQGRAKPGVILAAFVVGGVVLWAILAPVLAPFDPYETNLRLINAPPLTEGHILGTDASGRDILSRLIYGARSSLFGPLVAILFASLAGISVGAFAAWRGGWLDRVLSQVTDFLFAFPGLLAAVFAVALFGPGILAPAIGVAVAYTPIIARLTRTVILQEKDKLYVKAERVLGFSSPRILFTAVMPNALPIVISQSILSFGYALIDLAALSFLGLGVQAPTPDWGVMLNESTSSILQGAWWVMLSPAVVIVAVVVAFNVLGEELLSLTGGRYQ